MPLHNRLIYKQWFSKLLLKPSVVFVLSAAKIELIFLTCKLFIRKCSHKALEALFWRTFA